MIDFGTALVDPEVLMPSVTHCTRCRTGRELDSATGQLFMKGRNN